MVVPKGFFRRIAWVLGTIGTSPNEGLAKINRHPLPLKELVNLLSSTESNQIELPETYRETLEEQLRPLFEGVEVHSCASVVYKSGILCLSIATSFGRVDFLYTGKDTGDEQMGTLVLQAGNPSKAFLFLNKAYRLKIGVIKWFDQNSNDTWEIPFGKEGVPTLFFERE